MTALEAALWPTVLPAAFGAMAAALCLYRTSAHQRLAPATTRPGRWQLAASVLLLASVALCQPRLGLAAALGVVSCSLMLACVLLPFLDAWRRVGRS